MVGLERRRWSGRQAVDHRTEAVLRYGSSRDRGSWVILRRRSEPPGLRILAIGPAQGQSPIRVGAHKEGNLLRADWGKITPASIQVNRDICTVPVCTIHWSTVSECVNVL